MNAARLLLPKIRHNKFLSTNKPGEGPYIRVQGLGGTSRIFQAPRYKIYIDEYKRRLGGNSERS